MAGDIGSLTGKLFRLKQRKSALNEELKDINKDIFSTQFELLKVMQDQGLTKVSDEHGTAYISTQTVPKVVNWDAFYKYIYENEAGHLLERRPSRSSFKEMYEEGIPVPGVDPHTFDEIRTRSS